MWLAIVTGCLVLAAVWAWLETKPHAAVKERQARLSTALERQDDLRRWLGYGNDQTQGS